MNSFSYRLSKDTYFCLLDDLLVFASLQDDQYRCLSRSNTRAALSAIPSLQGRDAAPDSAYSDAEKKQATQVMRALVSSGLLTDDCARGKEIAPVDVPRPTSSLLPFARADSSPDCSIGHWIPFISASLGASSKLRMQSLLRTVRGVEERRRRHCTSDFQDNDTLHQLVALFHHFRPYYVRNYLCRFDSLALVEFLARYHQFPVWVFGVRGMPFGAHCWVQEDDCVLNDSVEYVSQFTPIMAF